MLSPLWREMMANGPPLRKTVLVVCEGIALALAFGVVESFNANKPLWIPIFEFVLSASISYAGFKWEAISEAAMDWSARKKKAIVASSSALLIAGLLAVLVYAHIPDRPFRIETGLTFLNLTHSLENTNSGPFWVTYHSGYGDSASPVALAQYIDITNLTAIPQSIRTYAVSVKTDSCDWIDLTPIPINGSSVWWTYNGLSRAALLDFSVNGLDFMMSKPVQPGLTMSGWWFFDSASFCSIPTGDTLRYRIKLTTHSRIEYEMTTDPKTINEPISDIPKEGRATGPQFILPEGAYRDISGLHKKLYYTPLR